MVRRSSLAWGMAALIWTGAALGQPQDPREVEARKDCLTGKVDDGVALLADLFAETTNPNFIYNQARCYEQNGRAEDAINRFREYLRVAKDITAEDKADVDQHILGCRAMQAEQQAAREAAAAVPAPAPEATPPAAVAPPPPAIPAPDLTAPPLPEPGPAAVPLPPAPGVNEAATVPTSVPADGAGLRLVGTVSMALGIVSLGAGAVFSGLVVKSQNQAESDVNDKRTYDPDVWSRGQTYQTLQWVGYGTGAALVGTGIVLYWLGSRRGNLAPTVSLVPSVAPRQGSVRLCGSF